MQEPDGKTRAAVGVPMRLSKGAEIGIEALIEFYGEQKAARGKTARDDAPSAGKVMRPKVLRNATGKPVSVRGWTPKRAV